VSIQFKCNAINATNTRKQNKQKKATQKQNKTKQHKATQSKEYSLLRILDAFAVFFVREITGHNSPKGGEVASLRAPMMDDHCHHVV
jgi:hypothetical protein